MANHPDTQLDADVPAVVGQPLLRRHRRDPAAAQQLFLALLVAQDLAEQLGAQLAEHACVQESDGHPTDEPSCPWCAFLEIAEKALVYVEPSLQSLDGELHLVNANRLRGTVAEARAAVEALAAGPPR